MTSNADPKLHVPLQGEHPDLTKLNDKLSQAVFPLLGTKEDGSPLIIGTGFFISPAGIFITAKHVLEDFVSNGKMIKPIGAMQFDDDDKYYIRTVAHFSQRDIGDIAVGVLQSMTNNKTGETLKNKVVKLTKELAPPGSKVMTYAIPNHGYVEGPDTKEVHMWPAVYHGELQEWFLEGNGPSVKITPPYAMTNVNLHATASGGPVFDENGLVFAINSSSYDGTTDVSFVTPVALALDLNVQDVLIPPETIPRAVSVRELAFLKCIHFD